MDKKTLEELKKTLRFHARGLEIPDGSAKIFVECAVTSAAKSLKNKKIITAADLTRAVTRELKKYNKDLAYVYENYDKII